MPRPLQALFTVSWILLVAGAGALAQQPQRYYTPTAGTWPNLNLAAGAFFCGDTLVPYGGGSLVMTGSATNYVFLDRTSNCAPTSNTTGFPTTGVPIATVSTSSGSITTITNLSTWFPPVLTVLDVSSFGGATAGAQIANCIAALPSTGGTCDARGLTGAQTILTNPFANLSKQVTVLLGAGTYTTTTLVTPNASTPNGLVRLIGMGPDSTILVASAQNQAIISGTTATPPAASDLDYFANFSVQAYYPSGSSGPAIEMRGFRNSTFENIEYLSNSGGDFAFFFHFSAGLSGSAGYSCYNNHLIHPTVLSQTGPSTVFDFDSGGVTGTSGYANVQRIDTPEVASNTGISTVFSAAASTSLTIIGGDVESNTAGSQGTVVLIAGDNTSVLGGYWQNNSNGTGIHSVVQTDGVDDVITGVNAYDNSVPPQTWTIQSSATRTQFINDYGQMTFADATTSPGNNLITSGALSWAYNGRIHYGAGSSPTIAGSSNGPAVYVYRNGTSSAELATGEDTVSPYEIWLQGRHQSIPNLVYPIVFNPLGGNVGIGTTSPSYPLTVANYSAPNDTLSNMFLLQTGADGTLGPLNLNISGYPTANPGTGRYYQLSVGDNNAARPFVFASGVNVGIGTTSPGSALQVGAGTALSVNGVVPQINNVQTSGQAAVGLYVNDGTNNRRASLFVDNTNSAWGLYSTFHGTGMPFTISQAGSEVFRITGGGDVGIGTTGPALQLQVHKAMAAGVAPSPTCSGTPLSCAFDASQGNTQVLTLSANSYSTIGGLATGEVLNFVICQGGTVYSFSWPTTPTFKGAITVSSIPNACIAQSFVYDGTNMDALPRSGILQTQTVNLASVATGACSVEQSVTVNGALLGDPVSVTANTALEAGGFLVGKVTAADTVKWQFCNLSGAAIDRANDTYNIFLNKQ